MLAHLAVKNLALIDHIELALSPGLTVLTGETGAGKSILVEALLLLLGQRASADVVRTGAAEGVVEAQFHLSGVIAAEVSALLDDAGLPSLEDGVLVLRRVISREGRHKQQVNGALCTVAQLKTVAEPLVDFTGQHAHQQLLRPTAALPMLDGFAGVVDDVKAMGVAYQAALRTASELAELRAKEAEKERRLDVIRFYLDEIEALRPERGEDVTLEAERRRLQNASKLRESLAEAHELLNGGDNDVLTLAQQAQQALARAERDDADLAPLARSLDEAIAIIDDVARTLNKRRDVEDDPERLAAVEDRLDALKRVMKKHGGDLDAVLAAEASLASERSLLEDASTRIAQLEAQLGRDVAAAAVVADRLHAARTQAATRLARAIEVELPSLGMANAKIFVNVEALPAATTQTPTTSAEVRRADGRPLTKTGGDKVELMFTANAGEAPAPLSKVASGGELSRVLLAVKRVLLAADPVPVSVFDEVDAGVGGAVGEAIGEKLAALAALDVAAAGGRQVLCITHLAQIAARGDGHLVVEKGVSDGRTVSRVRLVQGEGRVDEIARMLGGREITEATLSHAKDMLARAQASRSTSTSTSTSSSAKASTSTEEPAPKKKAKRA